MFRTRILVCADPACGESVAADARLPGGDARCPRCGGPLAARTSGRAGQIAPTLPLPEPARPEAPREADSSADPSTELTIRDSLLETPTLPPPVESIGRYRDATEVARGGMGAIYRALDPDLDRPVAIKVSLTEGGEGSYSHGKFLQEARTTGQLEHPNIVPVHEMGRTPGGRPYFSMKLVKGRSLAEVLDTLREDPRRAIPSRRRLLGDFLKICDAVAFAHSRGVIHRDLKPANVMVGEYGEVLVMDWGLARTRNAELGTRSERQEAAPDSPAVTVAGTVMGTPAYMPPEQAAGEIDRVGERSDIYSLGAILYEILTLTPPYSGKTGIEILDRIGRSKLDPPAARAPAMNVPRELEAVVVKAMARSPEDRYAQVGGLKEDIEAYLAGHTLSAARYTPLQRAAKFVLRHQAASAVAALAGAVVLVLTAGFVWRLDLRRREAEDRSREAQEARDREQVARALAEQKSREAEEAAARADREARETRRLLGHSLEERGRAALGRGEHQRAALLLAAALEIEESPGRRGLALGALARCGAVLELGATGDRVAIVEWSPDGKSVAGIGADGNALLWDAATGAVRKRDRGPEAAPIVAAWSPGGERLAIAWVSGEFGLWDMERAGPPRLARANEEPAKDLAWTPDGDRLASLSTDGTVRIRDGRAGEIQASLPREGKGVDAFLWSPDGERLWTASPAGTVRTHDGRTGALLSSREGTLDGISAEWSPAGESLAIRMRDGELRILDGRSGEERALIDFRGEVVRGFAWSPDGSRIALLHIGEVSIRDAATGTQQARLSGHAMELRHVAWSPCGARLATASLDRTAGVWDAASGDGVAVIEGHDSPLRSVEWSPDGRRLATHTEEGAVRIWEAPLEFRLLGPGRHAHRVPAVALSPDGGTLASASLDGTLRLWEAATGRPRGLLEGHAGPVRAVAWSPEGGRLASGSDDGTARIWDAATGKLLATLEGHRMGVMAVAWSPDGEKIASSAPDQTVRFWDGRTGAHQRGQGGTSCRSLAFSPDGARLAGGATDGAVHIFRADGATRLAVFQGSEEPVMSVCWSPGGDRLASAGLDHAIRILDSRTGELLATLSGHSEPAILASWSPDGSLLATSSTDGTFRLWDTTRWEPSALFPEMVLSAAWSPDGARLYALAADGVVRVVSADLLRAPASRLRALASEATGLALAGFDVVPAGTRPADGG